MRKRALFAGTGETVEVRTLSGRVIVADVIPPRRYHRMPSWPSS